MGDFAIIAEGFTDQVVLRNILLGFFEAREEEPFVNFEQPQYDATSAGEYAHGGWSLVIHYFRQRKFLQALQLNQYLVVHIDLDVASEYGIALVHEGRERSSEELIEAVIETFRRLIGEDIVREHGHRFLFAIGCDAIECWLLPLVFDPSQKARRSKTTGCLEAINHQLRKDSKAPLSKADGSDKEPSVYRSVSRDYLKRKILDQHKDANPGLAAFVSQLDAVVLPSPE